jgi:hypothetical protein
MPSASLNKMTVPLASDQSASAQGLLMPKLRYRFRVSFENFGVDTENVVELTKQVVSFARPNLTFENIDLPIYNSTLKLAGKYAWQDIQCVLRDDASGAITRLVGQQLQKQFDFAEMASAAAGIDYKFLTRFQILDGGNGNSEPTVLEQWELYGCYLQSVDYGPMAYGTNEAVEITMTLRFDNANQSETDEALGTSVGRTVGDVVTSIG